MASRVQVQAVFVFVLVSYAVLSSGSSEDERDELTVRIPDGYVRGEKMKSENGDDFIAFRGIPYAEPPIGELRFKSPVANKPWTGIRNATADAPVCPQISKGYRGSEDCLYLNVYTPKLPGNSSSRTFDVVFNIHGGGFTFGSGISSHYGPHRFPLKEIVLVSPTYRVSALGFLSTNDSSSPGNYGLLDQLEALRWVQKNIEYFGGDPERVTLLGQSAGGVSVMYLQITPLAQGLFHRVIALSGTPLIPYGLQKDPLFWTTKLASDLNCPVDDSEKLVMCLRNKTAQEIIEYSFEYDWNVVLYTFVPTVDNYFLTDTPLNLLKNGLFPRNISLMLGATKGERYCWFTGGKSSENVTDDEIFLALLSIIDIRPNVNDTILQIKERYFANITSRENDVVQEILRKAVTEGKYQVPVDYTANLMMDYGLEPYFYRYDFEGPWFNRSLNPGVCHADDLYLLFDGTFHVESFDEVGQKMKEKYQKLITNFIKTGDPNGGDGLMFWPQSKAGHLLRYHINSNFSVEEYDYSNDDLYLFWTKVLNDLNVKNLQDVSS